jgi:hypothetical protein
MKENLETWESLQKGQIAELAFERIALAHGYAVKYSGRQYKHLLEPSEFREHTPYETDKWLPDFKLKKRVGDKWVRHAVVEVKWRKNKQDIPNNVPPKSDYLVLFTPEGLFAACAKDGKVAKELLPLEQVAGLGFKEGIYSEILKATQSLIEAFESLNVR